MRVSAPAISKGMPCFALLRLSLDAMVCFDAVELKDLPRIALNDAYA